LRFPGELVEYLLADAVGEIGSPAERLRNGSTAIDAGAEPAPTKRGTAKARPTAMRTRPSSAAMPTLDLGFHHGRAAGGSSDGRSTRQ
jgi:hypothetical protein